MKQSDRNLPDIGLQELTRNLTIGEIQEIHDLSCKAAGIEVSFASVFGAQIVQGKLFKGDATAYKLYFETFERWARCYEVDRIAQQSKLLRDAMYARGTAFLGKYETVLNIWKRDQE